MSTTEKTPVQRWLDGENHPVREFDEPLFEPNMFGIVDLSDTPPIQSLEQMQQRVYETNVANGWFEADRTFGEDIALLHSEVSEALEAFRDHGVEDVTDWPKTPDTLVREVGDPEKARELFIEHQKSEGKLPKPAGVGSELADVLVRLLDTCHRYGIDLEAEFNRKMAFNATRGHRHGGKRL